MSRRLSSTPLDDDDLLWEILLRLPPQPSSLPRASIVCTRWHNVVSDPQFLGRFRQHHQKPPLLGFFARAGGGRHVFTPVLGSPDRIPTTRFPMPRSCKSYEHWDFRGCRHGLAVLINDCRTEAVVWDPLIGEHRRVPFPSGLRNGSITQNFLLWLDAALMCTDAEDGHVHGDCFRSPFKLILMCQGQTHAFACVYSSVPGVWGNVISTAITHSLSSRPGILVGNAVHWLFYGGNVLAFDTERQSLGVIDKPTGIHGTDSWSFQLLRTSDDVCLGLAVLSKLSIQSWKRQSNYSGVVEWVLLQKTIQLDGLLPPRTFSTFPCALMVGYDEDSNEIVLGKLGGNGSISNSEH